MKELHSSIFVQPHLDDVPFSCGGLVALHAEQDLDPLIVTIFAGDPPAKLTELARTLHELWGLEGNPTIVRRSEDAAAARVLGADTHWLAFQDVLYRLEEGAARSRFRERLLPGDDALVEQITAELVAIAEHAKARQLFFPLSIGNHVDHQVGRIVGQQLERVGVAVAYYEDFPYALDPVRVTSALSIFGDGFLQPELVDISTTIDRRIEAIGQYKSQLHAVFGQDPRPYEQQVRDYASGSGIFVERIWRAPSVH